MSSEILQNTLVAFRGGKDLSADDAGAIFDAMIAEANEDFLMTVLDAWNEKGIAEDEMFHLASIMRSRMRRISSKHDAFIDAVGTGGSRSKTFNVSTAAAFVIAGAGVPVAKHGNRAASSKTGSADVLSELGIRVDVEPEHAERCLNEHDICFMFAPKFHSLSPALAAARRRLAKPTIFNCLGPLCNPAGAPHQVIGVWDASIALSMANVLARLGTNRSWVVHGSDGLDEISLSASTTVYEVCCDKVRGFEISPEEFGVEAVAAGLVPTVKNAAESAAIVQDILNNRSVEHPAEALVLINAAAGIYLSGHAGSPAEAMDAAVEGVRSGKASEKLSVLGAATNR